MNNPLIKKLSAMKKGGKVGINNKIYSIRGKEVHKAKNKYESGCIKYSLGNNCFLEIIFNEPVFYKNIEKKGFLGFITTKSHYIKIKDIQVC